MITVPGLTFIQAALLSFRDNSKGWSVCEVIRQGCGLQIKDFPGTYRTMFCTLKSLQKVGQQNTDSFKKLHFSPEEH